MRIAHGGLVSVLAQAVEELSAAGRKRTLLLMLEALYRFETHGAVHGGEPPSADYFGRPGVGGAQSDEVDAREVVVIHDDEDGASGAPESAAAKLLAAQVATLTAQLADANAAADAARAAAAAAQAAAERVTAEKGALETEKATLEAAVANEAAQHKQAAAQVTTLTAQLADAISAAKTVRSGAAELHTSVERLLAEKAALEAAVASEAALHNQTAASLVAKQKDIETLSAKLEATEARETRQREQVAKAQNAVSVAAAALRDMDGQAAVQMVFAPVFTRNRAEQLSVAVQGSESSKTHSL